MTGDSLFHYGALKITQLVIVLILWKCTRVYVCIRAELGRRNNMSTMKDTRYVSMARVVAYDLSKFFLF